MRPERKAPENSVWAPSSNRRQQYLACFNEAGAKSPGEHRLEFVFNAPGL